MQQDIEIVVNAADQPRVFELLSSHGLSISTPVEQDSEKPASLQDWYETARSVSSSEYRDRRRTRLVTPIYELPATSDPLDYMLRPYIIVYSAEEVGLPSFPPVSSPTSAFTPAAAAAPSYVPLSILDPDLARSWRDPSATLPDGLPPLADCMVPSLELLIKSEMHVLLVHAEPRTPAWGQHMAQLSELVHARARRDGKEAGGLDMTKALVAIDARLRDFVLWFRASLEGEADYGHGLEKVRASYQEAYKFT